MKHIELSDKAYDILISCLCDHGEQGVIELIEENATYIESVSEEQLKNACNIIRMMKNECKTRE